MMNIAEIDKVAAHVAGHTIVGGSVSVHSEPMVDNDGREALAQGSCPETAISRSSRVIR